MKGLLRHFVAGSALEVASVSATTQDTVPVETPSPEPTIADGAYGFFADVYKVLSMPIQVCLFVRLCSYHDFFFFVFSF